MKQSFSHTTRWLNRTVRMSAATPWLQKMLLWKRRDSCFTTYLAPNDSEAQLSPALSYGKMVPLQGIKEQTEAARRIKDAADKAIRLDPHNDLAWHVLGRWNRVLANVNVMKRVLASFIYGELPAGSNAEAVLCFQKAIEINPNRLMHYIELGQTYAQMGKTADARRLIAKGLAMPDVEKDDPEIKRRGRETLAKLQ